MTLLSSDLRLAARGLRRRPAFTALAVLTLTIGVGANTAVFGLINSVFLEPLPLIQNPERLVEINRNLGGDFADVSYGVFQAMRAERGVLEDAAAYAPVPASISTAEDATPVVRMVSTTTGSYFDLLGVRPGIGRFFAPGEASSPSVSNVVVISDRFWREQFGADRSVIGRTLRLNGVALEVIGVTPPAFRGHANGLAVDAYIPLGVAIPGLPTRAALDDPRSSAVQVLGRLRPGVTTTVAAEALGTAAMRYLASVSAGRGARGPDAHPVRVDAFSPVPAVIRDGVAAFLAVLLAVSGLLLSMTCVNVAGMILSRATERRTEIAVRYALGATRKRIVTQLLTESVLLFLVAGVAGAIVAAWVTPLLAAFQPPLPPGYSVDLDLRANWTVVVYASLIATACGIVFSTAPVLRATRTDLAPMLREQSGGGSLARTRVRGVLVGIQMAGTLVLLIVAGLFTRALGALDALDPGWNPNGVYVTSLDMELNGTSASSGKALFGELIQRVSAVPGVRVAAVASKLPFSGQSSLGAVVPEGGAAPSNDLPAYFNRVSAGYFQAMGIRLLRGRDVAVTDVATTPNVAVINEAMAARLWPGADPVGRRFQTGSAPYRQTFAVIGVAANSKIKRLNEDTPNAYYLPYTQMYNSQMSLIVRLADGVPPTRLDAVRGIIRDLSASLPAEPVRPLRSALELYFLPQRIAAWVGGVLGLIGMLIAAVGTYGVAAIAVAQRRRELGIRLALGARSRDLVSLLLGRVMRAPVIGLGVGLIVSLGLTQPLERFLGVVHPLDPVAFGGASLALVVVILVAIFVPATTASRLNPVDVLKSD
jgi:predicted permease